MARDLSDAAEKALRRLERSGDFHDEKLRRIRKQQEAYEGILSVDSEAAQWQSKVAPPLINHLMETAMTMLEDDIAFKVSPMPRFYAPDAWHSAMDGARAHERLMRRQLLQDHFDEFQRPFILQAAINRVSVAKTYWREEDVKTKELQWKPLAPMLGRMSPQRMREVEVTKPLFSGPVTETVDLRDFYWAPSAISLERSPYAAHAVWMLPEDILKAAKDGQYDMEAAQEIADLESGASELPPGNEIEQEREKRSRRAGLVEVLEIWDRTNRMLYVIGRRRVLLAEKPWPFWHKQYPFTTLSLAPFPFSIQGLSLVEKLAPMQDMYWSFLNQSIDNAKLINNAIILMAADYDDPDSFEYAPGAVNTVDRPDQIVLWTPNTQFMDPAMNMLQLLQTNMQDLAMGQPIAMPVAGRVTATEIAVLSQISQNAAKKMKDQVNFAYERIGYQRLKLNQQFLRDAQYIHTLGLDSEPLVEEIMPQLLAGDFDFILDAETESDLRQERRSEAQQLMTLAIQAAPVMAAMQAPLNGKAFMNKVLEAFDVPPEDFDEFYSAQPQTPPNPQNPTLPQPGADQGAGPGGEPVGTTAPAPTPSTAQEMGPGALMAKAMASQGAVR